MKRFALVLSSFVVLLCTGSCTKDPTGGQGGAPSGSGFTLTSPAFDDDGPLPAVYSLEGGNKTPPLAWSKVPEGTQSLVLICHDPDAPGGNFTHWLAWDIPAVIGKLEEGQPKTALMMCGGAQGLNDFGTIGWDGPAPPSGTHRYMFTLIALDTPKLPLEPGKALRSDVDKHLRGHEKGRALLTGTFSK